MIIKFGDNYNKSKGIIEKEYMCVRFNGRKIEAMLQMEEVNGEWVEE